MAETQGTLPGTEPAPEPKTLPDVLLVTGYCDACGSALRSLPAFGGGLDVTSLLHQVSGCCRARVVTLCMPFVSKCETAGFQAELRVERPGRRRAPATGGGKGDAP